MKYNTNMFDSIRDALNNQQQKQNTGTRDIITLEKGSTYVVRLLPNIKDPDKTWFKYSTFGWNSFATGAYTSAISPTSWNERDPIAEERIRIYRNGTEADKEKIKNIRRSDRWIMNAYVVSDPTNPENNGKVKLIRFGKQLFNIINNAISGEDADEFGAKIFDLTSAGVNLKIKVDDQGGFANYTASRFTSPVDLKLTDEQIEGIYNSVKELDKVFTIRSYDDLKKLLDDHYHCQASAPAASPAPSKAPASHAEQFTPSETVSETSFDDEDDEEKMRKLINDLG
jgi:hypothetical protein